MNTDTGRPKLQVAIVCPTARGGHLEHALELASAFNRKMAAGVHIVVVSRKGASDYAISLGSSVQVLECIPPLPSAHGGFRRFLQYLLALLKERRVLRQLVRENGLDLVVLEEPRLPSPRWLGRDNRVALILHNAVEHEGARAGLAHRAKAKIRKSCIQRSSRVIVFGERQAQTVSEVFGVRATSIPLPLSTFLEVVKTSPTPLGDLVEGKAVCIGEIRRNKGYEVAIAATAISSDPLFILGAPVDMAYFAELRSQAAEHVQFQDSFITPHEFEDVLRRAGVILLPYTSFEAQSGVLARAGSLGTPVLVSDLPSLREQARSFPNAQIVPVGDAAELADSIAKARALRTEPHMCQDDWMPLVEALI